MKILPVHIICWVDGTGSENIAIMKNMENDTKQHLVARPKQMNGLHLHLLSDYCDENLYVLPIWKSGFVVAKFNFEVSWLKKIRCALRILCWVSPTLSVWRDILECLLGDSKVYQAGEGVRMEDLKTRRAGRQFTRDKSFLIWGVLSGTGVGFRNLKPKTHLENTIFSVILSVWDAGNAFCQRIMR